jgi:antitoxin MazE
MTTNAIATPQQKTWHTKLCSWGTSQAVRIPKDVCEDVGLKPGDELDITAYRDADGIGVLVRSTLKKHRSFTHAPRISLRELFRDYQGEYRGEELDWGNDVGTEVIK